MMLGALRLPIVAAMLSLPIASACTFANDLAHKRKLESLLKRGATRPQIVSVLGDDYQFSQKNTASWALLQTFLDREPATDFLPARENAQKYPKVMLYSYAWHITWIFLDEKDVLRAYY